jgi:ATP-dependent RNA helicase SUPV3L1/SUV3
MAGNSYSASRIAAILGPTNTGKTHYAIDRMVAHASGMIGFPLRLLARENYDRVVRAKGAGQVALVTGEEKIVPPNPRYFVCSVEAMPLDRAVEFLAVDEIQMCADAERGHVFTDRLLHARGLSETLFLGSDTMRGVISRLIPGIEVQTRPRMSRLSFAGAKKLARLPRRSAIVAFSAADVYAIADMVRRHRGGAAVVLGALSPRTRNAQVRMYQSGEVDFLVATDAIGMGLNMDIDHVAFAQTVKYDGAEPRQLSPAEIGQIAGRAGRHMNDGSFGTTADAPGFDAETVERVESHALRAVRGLFWRNRALRVQSPETLLKSLLVPPPGGGLPAGAPRRRRRRPGSPGAQPRGGGAGDPSRPGAPAVGNLPDSGFSENHAGSACPPALPDVSLLDRRRGRDTRYLPGASPGEHRPHRWRYRSSVAKNRPDPGLDHRRQPRRMGFGHESLARTHKTD